MNISNDAKFEDGAERPLRLKALDEEDLRVVSSLAQDSVFPGSEMLWQRTQRRFAILLNRFRWEDPARERHGAERVQSVLAFEDVISVQSQGVARDAETVFSLLAIEFITSEDGAGRIELTLAGDGAIALEVEALEVSLKDVTRPYGAPSGAVPEHPE